MRFVILPQAFRNMLPVLLTQTIVLFQDTSLVYAIGAKDLLKASEIAGKNYNRPVEMVVFVALVYFLICYSLSFVVSACRHASPSSAEPRPVFFGMLPMNEPAMIEMRNVSKWYGQFQVLTDCSTQVSRGEVIVVCGPSGSGKSTLIKCVNASKASSRAKSSSRAPRWATPRPIYPSCAPMSAWCSSISSCFRT